MTSWQIINCKRCGAIFRKLCSHTCPECVKVIQDASHRMYQYAHDHPNVTLGEIADACGIDIRDAEFVFFDGGLGTASAAIMLHCAQCGKPVRQIERKGRLCMGCADQFEADARRNAGYESKEKEKERQTIESARNLKGGVKKEPGPAGTVRSGKESRLDHYAEEEMTGDASEQPEPQEKADTFLPEEAFPVPTSRPLPRYGFIRYRD